MAHKFTAVKGGVAATLGCALAATAFAVPANAEALSSGEVIQPTSGTTQINLIGFNDFHGRITKVSDFAASVLQVQDTFGADNSLIIGNGDQFGASEFESSVAADQPSKDALTALGVDVITAGNHEFDKGQDDALAIQQEFGTLLAANVVKADGSLLLDAYQTFEVAGHTVAVIGAVTASTPSGVTPDGIAGLTFGDPVDAVNEVAAQLSDGNEENGEADILVASYHEGGPTSGAYSENAANEVFRKMAEDTAEQVDAVFNAHTHQTYNYEQDGRQVVQAGSYADALGQIVLTVDEAGEVTSSSSSVVPTYSADDAPRVTRDQLSSESQAIYDSVDTIRADALAEAETLGAEQIGVVNENISRAYTWEGGSAGSDTRDQESTLGSVVADSMMLWAQGVGTEELNADLSIMNPGGLRADIVGDGTLTYKDAQTVLPFVNNLAVVSLTGAELKNVLEEQWQVEAGGEVPARPYLQLGISSNVDYSYQGSITDDPKTTQGQHITSVYIDGNPIDDEQVYKVVMPTFLASGGDNFHSINNNEGVYDTGSVDLDAFVAYVQSLAGSELKAEHTRNGFNVAGYFIEGATPELAAGESLTFTVKDLDLHSQDLIANKTVEVMLDGEKLGEAAVTGATVNGEITTAEVTITLPAGAAAGDYSIQVVAQPSGSTVHLPLTVTDSITPVAASLELDRSSASYGDTVTATVRGLNAGEQVTVKLGGESGAFGAATADENGVATFPFAITESIAAGSYEVVAVRADGSEVRASLTVAEQAAQLVTEKSTYTAAESAKGIEYKGVNFAPNAEVKITLTIPSGDVAEIETLTTDAEGVFGGSLVYQTIDEATGAVVQDNLPWPAGSYTITAMQAETAATAEFTVAEGAGSSEIPGKSDADGSGLNLAVTGANETAMFAGIAAGVLALVAGAALMVRRRAQ